MMTKVTGVFRDTARVAAAVNALLGRHYNPEEIEVVLCTSAGSRRVRLTSKNQTFVFGGRGAVLGAILGGLAAVFFSVGALSLAGPDMFSPNPIVAFFQGVLSGSGFLGLCGFIAGLGAWRAVPEVKAAEVRDGTVSVAVRARGERAEHVTRIFEDAAAAEITKVPA